jgi:hypothetical protein
MGDSKLIAVNRAVRRSGTPLGLVRPQADPIPVWRIRRLALGRKDEVVVLIVIVEGRATVDFVS